MTLETRKLLCQINSFYCGLALLYHLEFFTGRICIPVGSGARYNTLLMFFLAEMVKGVSAQLTGETEMLEAKAELFSGRRDSGGRRERYEKCVASWTNRRSQTQ